MLTFSQLARADPLEDDQVVGETRTFGATDSTVRTCQLVARSKSESLTHDEIQSGILPVAITGSAKANSSNSGGTASGVANLHGIAIVRGARRTG